MKAKNAKGVLSKKFNDFVESITDPVVKDLVKNNSIITGGAIASLLLGEEVHDYDVYFRDHATTLAVAKYYVNQFTQNPPKFKNGATVAISVRDEENRVKIVVKSAGVASETATDDYQYFESTDAEAAEAAEYLDAVLGVKAELDAKNKPKYRPVYLTANAITLANKVQLVIRFFGEPEEIHKNYDFVHCTNYWTSWDNHIVLRPEAVEALLARELRYVGSLYPICSLIRTRKFIQRDWKITAGAYLKMAMQISKLDLTNFKVLEDQLTGVDVAYFTEMLNKLKDKDPTKVDTSYLMELVDRLF